ncbi:hypothetical protein HK098_006140 [Nowakowskiella sp. JEL0407]|nr:hypothetical protein HK098_006140 [Nowakowskiella sp. JEL0407]
MKKIIEDQSNRIQLLEQEIIRLKENHEFEKYEIELKYEQRSELKSELIERFKEVEEDDYLSPRQMNEDNMLLGKKLCEQEEELDQKNSEIAALKSKLATKETQVLRLLSDTILLGEEDQNSRLQETESNSNSFLTALNSNSLKKKSRKK